MRKNLQRTSRRTFLKRISGSIAATTIGAAGWSNISFKNNSRSSSAVFSEGQIGSLQVNNRLIRAATYERAGANGIPTDAYIKMIESLAVGGVGMIITGAIAANPPGMETQIHVFDQHHSI